MLSHGNAGGFALRIITLILASETGDSTLRLRPFLACNQVGNLK
jgi:hypothetical protein